MNENIQVLFSEQDIAENRFLAAIGYISFLFFIPLFLKKQSPFAQFHGKQALYLFIVSIVGQIVFWIPLFGWALFLFFVGVNIYAIFQALLGNSWVAPGYRSVKKFFPL